MRAIYLLVALSSALFLSFTAAANESQSQFVSKKIYIVTNDKEWICFQSDTKHFDLNWISTVEFSYNVTITNHADAAILTYRCTDSELPVSNLIEKREKNVTNMVPAESKEYFVESEKRFIPSSMSLAYIAIGTVAAVAVIILVVCSAASCGKHKAEEAQDTERQVIHRTSLLSA